MAGNKSHQGERFHQRSANNVGCLLVAVGGLVSDFRIPGGIYVHRSTPKYPCDGRLFHRNLTVNCAGLMDAMGMSALPLCNSSTP